MQHFILKDSSTGFYSKVLIFRQQRFGNKISVHSRNIDYVHSLGFVTAIKKK